jgi:hypothetical protein
MVGRENSHQNVDSLTMEGPHVTSTMFSLILLKDFEGIQKGL